MDWQPIKTAPKDGTRILLAERNPGGTQIPWLVIEGRWIDCPHMNDSAGRTAPAWMAAYPAVYDDGEGGKTWVCKPIASIRASYWQPLPSPPDLSPPIGLTQPEDSKNG
jgi:hypothetical protein